MATWGGLTSLYGHGLLYYLQLTRCLSCNSTQALHTRLRAKVQAGLAISREINEREASLS